jgi:hypothetical protein
MMRLAEWRDYPSSANFLLLHLPLPHLNPLHTILDARLAKEVFQREEVSKRQKEEGGLG